MMLVALAFLATRAELRDLGEDGRSPRGLPLVLFGSAMKRSRLHRLQADGRVERCHRTLATEGSTSATTAERPPAWWP